MAPSLLVLAMPSWEGDYMKSTVALVRELAATHRILYVEHPPTMTSQGRALLQGTRGRFRWSARLRVETHKDRHDICVFTPAPVLPMNAFPASAYDLVLSWNAARMRRTIRAVLAQLDMRCPVVLNALNPHYGTTLVDAFDEAARIYYCYDEIRARDWNGHHGGRMEDRYLTQVDAVVGTSAALQERLARHHDAAYLVPNGVDFDLFHRAAPAGAPASAGRSPCVGYLGSLDERLDYALLEWLIQAYPEWDFHFVGRICVPDAHRLNRHPNVTLTGPKPPEALPEALRAMDVGLIPFAQTPFTRCIYPLKVNEYLAAGRPVVSTAFADLSDFAGVIDVAETGEAFLRAVEKAVRPAPAAVVTARIEQARANSWARRGELLRSIVQYHAKQGCKRDPVADHSS